MARQTQFDIPQSNLSRLMNMTPRKYYQRKAKCRLVSQQYGAGSRRGFKRSRPRNPIFYNEMRVVVVCPSGQRRYSYVRFYGPPGPRTPVWVWCSCPDFGYRLEWLLTQIGCSTLDTGYNEQGPEIIDQPPDVQNEQEKLRLCKHLLLAAEMAQRQTKDFASEAGKQHEAAVQPRVASINSYRPGQIMTFG